jgi:hypothetical protein
MGGSPYVDDPTISDDADLWRRIFPKWKVLDANQGGYRVSSAAFYDSEDGTPLSLVLASGVRETGRTAQDIIKGYDGYGVAVIQAKVPRSRQQIVVRTPEPDEPAHLSVIGPKTDSNRKAMAKAARWVLMPP